MSEADSSARLTARVHLQTLSFSQATQLQLLYLFSFCIFGLVISFSLGDISVSMLLLN